MLRIFEVALLVLFLAGSARADLKMASLFQDHMVLQRDKPVNVWGWAEEGTKVTVQFADQKKTATTDKNGKWLVTLDPMAAWVEGRTMTFASSIGNQKSSIKDVLVGEVWVCSGQSNMQYTMSRFPRSAADVPNMKYPMIRHFAVVRGALTPLADVLGVWSVCSPETADQFSATALYFAVELYKVLNIPVGLINSSVGATSAYQWSDPETLAADPDIAPKIKEQKAKAAEMEAAQKANPGLMPAYEKAMLEYLAKVGGNIGIIVPGREKEFIKPDLSDPQWQPTTFPGTCGNGITWYAREIELPGAMVGKDLILDAGSSLFWNGVEVGSKRFHRDSNVCTIPAALTKEAKNVLSVRASSVLIGGLSSKPSISVADGPSLSLSGDGWLRRMYAGEPAFPEGLPAGQSFYGGLYNGMIAPLMPYAIRGVIWYQGENGPEGYTYRKVFRELIQSWRRNWGQGDFPFYFCQLANYHPKQHAIATDHDWPLIREAQTMALSLPNTGMACLIDIGKLGCQERDIHPWNKQDVGKRLALIARNKIYGEDIVSSGPMYDSMTVKGDKIIVKFKSVGSGLMSAGITGWYDHTIIPLPTHPPGLAIHGFTIAGDDGDFRMAHARIVGKDSVEVWHPRVPQPKYARFAWHRNPLHNLYNEEKLPAVPFRTDVIDLSAVNK
jgi:sialate O-acetylesterase